MSRRSSRLHTLERNLKAPRKSRAKRALTVMRLEGGATGMQSSLRPARLPKDIEDQIAVMRGWVVGKPSRGLLQLEERLLHARHGAHSRCDSTARARCDTAPDRGRARRWCARRRYWRPWQAAPLAGDSMSSRLRTRRRPRRRYRRTCSPVRAEVPPIPKINVAGGLRR
jgi:hypothetical protein